ncbi:DUF5789 family protein [Halocatena pleomorpha]|uniref:DUF2795 domain-containing protein n=1 Tax=Halocatena pleomorpha TaxID=1785090 RepID=A0A3P3R561_9EURY|nr:hypothetical protein [Halocatena pleomorpha]RRJ28627.1 hypothetical protein EIK79_15160 [Halocatena pleomorpha]
MTDDKRTTGRDESDPDPSRVQESAKNRSREQAEHAEHASRQLEGRFEEFKYPVSSEELATEYGDETIDLANETESLGSVFDRLADEQYETPTAVREAVYSEITGGAAGMEEYNAERDIDAVDAVNQYDEETNENERQR